MAAPVVLVHGAFSGPWTWDAVVADLAERGVDATTVGLTSSTAEGSFDADVEAVRAAVTAAGEPVVLVGHSTPGP
ncbi:esterase/lipase family protein [Pseudonocardia sp. RS010]|uniref:esterase/lipase family protein n=1 Tax=Pseudonocardia sp. RS010 TaxID=3385979 RepID=UPI0039A0AD63